ncbi:TOTE conflict system archaeo-eukaryotic primase domain-containing protein [Cohnella phaseoli]|uniref:TOTE conflict system primase domain-containing protein n=1 Tax=Cohnella phaseoli TaxID=456490 RepID=A0A3D9KIC7_9BACL|nr:hypothetical protein [Cohnella phaseoli]RED86195.1 hypothetical protein DFP98_10346 [Cohnella phaseoli]
MTDVRNIVDRLFDLYLIQNYHYLIQLKDGTYVTVNRRSRPLRAHHLNNHLRGRQPIGTFSGEFLTKFVCFDVDYRNPTVAKWVVYKLADTLGAGGFNDFATSFSGGKGYHVELFFDKAISIDAARKFFEYTIDRAGIRETEGGEVEYRPSSTQGVKLPLSVHQKTGSYCGFANITESLRVMSREESIDFLFTIKKTDHAAVLAVIAEEHAYDSRVAADMENAIGRHKPLAIYDQSESYTMARAAERYFKGLTGPGQRHKSFLLLARLMNHNGVDRADAFRAIWEWFEWQDTRLYTSVRAACLTDLRECVDHVYDNNKTLLIEVRDLTVTFEEIDTIIRRCPQKNQKALTYAMLIHSKRLACESGIFYMTFKQMEEAVGINESTARRQVTQLERLGVIDIISRNQAQKGTFKKKPNFYRMTFGGGLDERTLSVSEGKSLAECVRFFYSEHEIRDLLPRRQREALLAV